MKVGQSKGMYSLSRDAQQRLDAAAEAAGIPSLLLMERAGSAVSEYIHYEYEISTPVHIFCGKGKNAGDAYVLARLLLASSYAVEVWELDSLAARKSELAGSDSGIMRRALRGMGLEPKPVKQFIKDYRSGKINFYASDSGVLLVDGLLGTGYDSKRPFSKELRELAWLLRSICEEPYVQLLSIDIPSGVDAKSGLVDEYALFADVTVTFEYPKTGMLSYPGLMHSATTDEVTLGLSESFLEQFWAGESQFVGRNEFLGMAEILPKRAADAHKGMFGKGLLICGSRGMAGAAILAATAALRSGLGLLTALVPKSIYAACLQAAPSVMWQEMAEKPSELREQLSALLEGKSAVLFGSGSANLSQSKIKLVLELLRDVDLPLILDAEALNYLGAHTEFATVFFRSRPAGTVLTPHPGEFARLAPDLLSDNVSRLEQAATLARRFAVYLVLKGMGSVVAAADGRISVNQSGNSGLAQAGSGDVLAGILLAFASLAELDLYQAVQLGVFLHGLTAEVPVGGKAIYALGAEHLVEKIPLALQMLSHPEAFIDSLSQETYED